MASTLLTVHQNSQKRKDKKNLDNFQTPAWTLDYLCPYMLNPGPEKKVVWECACGENQLTWGLYYRGFESIGTDINDSPNFDFLTYEPSFEFDYIVTNPPYSGKFKEKFLERCYWWKKPFALLLPLTALGGKRRKESYKKYGLQIIMLPERVNFTCPGTNESSAWFEVAWFTNGLNLERDIIFP